MLISVGRRERKEGGREEGRKKGERKERKEGGREEENFLNFQHLFS